MLIHQDILKIVNEQILPDVVQIHEMDVPYPAELWVDGICEHQDGTAMFSIGDDGSLIAEYFAYDNTNRMLCETIGLQQVQTKLVMKATEVEIPVRWLSNSLKARTRHSILMPAVQGYKCAIRGWIGGSENTQMQSSTITLLNLPDLKLSKSQIRTPEESTPVEAVTMRGMETKKAVLALEAGDWKVRLTEGSTDWRQESDPLYYATLTKEDGSPFTLSDGDINYGIIDALYKFLSFQCGKWINIPTIVCNPEFSIINKSLSLCYEESNEDVVNAIRKYQAYENVRWGAWDELDDELRHAQGFEDVFHASLSSIFISQGSAEISFSKGNPYLERVWVNKLSPRSESDSSWTASDWQKWPSLFNEFWRRYNRNHRHLNNAIHHYVSCSEIFETSHGMDFAAVAARSTLESLVRWWNGLPEDHEFKGNCERGFLNNLVKAVEKAELGKDVQRQCDTVELQSVIARASQFRHRIGHGQAGNVDTDDMQRIIAHQQYMHNLARLLILAKLGNRNTDARGSFFSPTFKETQP